MKLSYNILFYRMSFEAYNLAEMIILARWAENIAKCSGDKEKEETYKKYKETLMGRETYKSVTIGMILLAVKELDGMTQEEVMDAVETTCRQVSAPDSWIVVDNPE